MADTDTVGRVRGALEEAGRVAVDRIDVTESDGVIVLRGSVASAEDASAAELVAEEHAEHVRNELRVDEHLREGPHTGDEGSGGYAPEQAGDDGRRGVAAPASPDVGMVSDTAHAVGENEPWDPPDQPHLAPTVAEQRGLTDRDTTDEPIAETGEPADPDETTPSATDLSAEELARSSHGRPGPGDPDAGRKTGGLNPRHAREE